VKKLNKDEQLAKKQIEIANKQSEYADDIKMRRRESEQLKMISLLEENARI
jgi:hypothetical protein